MSQNKEKVSNRTRLLGHLHGFWSAHRLDDTVFQIFIENYIVFILRLIIIFISDFVSPIRKDNGRLNWVRVKIPSCGNIGRAVAACPELENMPFYLDRNVDQDIKFGDTASYGLNNRFRTLNFVDSSKTWINNSFKP